MTLLPFMGNAQKAAGQESVHDGTEKNQRGKQIEGFILNAAGEGLEDV